MDKIVFQPIEINGMKLKNRIGFPPFANVPTAADGSVNDLTIRWYEERAKGGAGLIMTGPLRASAPSGPVMVGMGLSLYDDRFIPGLARLAEVMHSYGAKLGVQVAAVGPIAGKGASPSPYPDEKDAKDDFYYFSMGFRIPATEASLEEIEQVKRDFVAVTARAKAAGVDCVNLDYAAGGATLHCSFMSPFYNSRTDKYGRGWAGRLRFPVETTEEVREAVGKDYPIFARISSDEFLGKRGITLEDTCKIIVPALEKAGVDCIDVHEGSLTHTIEGILIPLYYPRGCYMHLTAEVKKAAEVPVIGVGRIVDLDMAGKLLEENKADIIYMGRQLTSDPETPNKYFEGRPEDIRTCIGCLAGCGRPCSINYDIQDEPIQLTSAEKPKRVLVIGGGVGGMEAARIAALRGHQVTLMEKDSELGGMVAALALTPLTAEFRNIVDYLATQMRKLKVDVRVCREATTADVEELKPDVVIVATGSSLVLPEVTRGKPGVLTHIEALRKKRELGTKVVIWGLVATDLAISLAEEGKDVILMGRGGEDTLARDHPAARRWFILRKLTDINVVRATPESARINNPEVLYYVEVEDITPEGIRVVNKDGERRVLPYDTLIISRERVINDSLFEELQKQVTEVYKIGDCSEVGDIKGAIWSANEVARKI